MPSTKTNILLSLTEDIWQVSVYPDTYSSALLKFNLFQNPAVKTNCDTIQGQPHDYTYNDDCNLRSH